MKARLWLLPPGTGPTSPRPNKDTFVLFSSLTTALSPGNTTWAVPALRQSISTVKLASSTLNSTVLLARVHLARFVHSHTRRRLGVNLCSRCGLSNTDAPINSMPLNTSISRNVSGKRPLPILYRNVES